MIPEDTYISYLPHRLIRVLDADHAVLAATIADMCSHTEDGTMEISLEYLSTIHGISKRTLQRQLQHLQQLQVIVYDSGDGRGNFGKFSKGDNFDTFCGIKGDKNGTLYEQERVTKIAIKGDKNGTLINKDILTAAERASEHAPAAENAAADGDPVKRSPRQGRKEKKMIDKQFQEFWMLFNPKDEFVTRKERCERVWYSTSPGFREAILNELRDGKRKHRDNPLHYLQYDTPEEAKAEFPIFRNGEAALGDAMKEAESGGRAIANVEAGARLHIPDNFAYVYLSDALANGLTIKWTVPKNAQRDHPEGIRGREEAHRTHRNQVKPALQGVAGASGAPSGD